MRNFNRYFYVVLTLLLFGACGENKKEANVATNNKRPNILILMADNASWNDVGSYGNNVIQTPNIDKVAQEGIMFSNAFCTSPSCAPARAAMLTGQDTWRLGEAANLWGGFPQVKVYPNMMETSGYHVGIEGKGWGPGN